MATTAQIPKRIDGSTWDDYQPIKGYEDTIASSEVQRTEISKPGPIENPWDKVLDILWKEIGRTFAEQIQQFEIREPEYSPFLFSAEAIEKISQIRKIKFSRKLLVARYTKKELSRFF